MGAFEEAKEWLVEKMGMWWPDADEGKLREGARHWRDFAEAVGDVTQATNVESGTLIQTNSGEATDTFEVFWNRYYHAGEGWLADLERTARAIASLLDKYANEVDQAKKDIDNQLAIDATVIAASIALAIPTGGASAGAGGAAAAAMIRFAASRGLALSAATAEIVATTITTAAYAGLEGVAVNLAVAQPLQIAVGQRDGLSLADAREAGVWSAARGGVFGGASTGVRHIKNSGGIGPVLQNFSPPTFTGPRPGLVGGDALPPWLRRADKNDPLKHTPAAWPSSKRKGRTAKHEADLKGDEGARGGHTIEKHVRKTSQGMRDRLRSDANITSDSRFLSSSAAQNFTDAVLAKNQRAIDNWLAGDKKTLPPLRADFDEATGLHLTRTDWKQGNPPSEVRGVNVILRRDEGTKSGFYVVTSYPVP